MQGWFGYGVGFLPPSHLKSLWIGTHFRLQSRKLLVSLRSLCPDFWENKEVGTRDKSTLKFLQNLGVQSYLSRCLTLTLPRRSSELEKNANDIFLVNLPDDFIVKLPKNITQNAYIINQRNIKISSYDESFYQKQAMNLLELYANKAKLVITSALHCASPCVAMGIPVAFIDFSNEGQGERFSALDGILKIQKPNGLIEFPSKAPNIEDLKSAMLSNLAFSLKAELSGKKEQNLKQIREFIANYEAKF